MNRHCLVNWKAYGIQSFKCFCYVYFPMYKSPILFCITDLDSNNPTLSSNAPCSLIPEHEELVAIRSVELTEEVESKKDPLADSDYIEFHYYQCEQYQYLVLPGNNDLDLETVEILQLDAEAQEAAGSLLDLAGGNH